MIASLLSRRPLADLRAWWGAAPAWTRFQVIALALMLVGHVTLQILFVYWYIEDAAISFAFARHAAAGEGLVAYPGGERVEGYSNPTWVFLMTAWELFGVNGFVSSKILGAVFGAATIWITWATTRLIRGRDDEVVPLLAALLLALNPQFVVWNASGLENSLFCFLLALGTWLTLREADSGRWPLSALAFFGLAITRPEGILYAFVAGASALVFTLHARRGLAPTLKWLATFFAPFTAYHALRYTYFAWPLPNTYYAKLDGKKVVHFVDFDSHGWKYLRSYAEELWQGWMLPIYVVAMTGLTRARGAVALVLVALLIGAVLAPRPDLLRVYTPWWPEIPVPEGWRHQRVWIFAGVAALTPLVALGRASWRGLVLNWALLMVGLYFAVHAGGDWMRGFRWLSLIAGPQAILYAIGLAEIADALARRFPAPTKVSEPEWFLSRGWSPQWSLAAGSAALIAMVFTIVPHVKYIEFYTRKPETSPAKIQRRVNYMHYVQHRLHLDHVVNLDIDMGGTMWWSGHELVDIAGLVDVSMGHHTYQREFIREYIFQERRPDFAHLHGGWERKMGVKSIPEYARTYFEIPGYPTGPTALHLGNRLRKDLLVMDSWHAPADRRVRYGEDVLLHGLTAPLGEVGAGGNLFIEVAWSGPKRPVEEGFRAVGFIRNGARIQTWDLPPGYDWYDVSHWAPGEIVYSRYALNVPADFPPGPYDLGVVVFGPDGSVLHPLEIPEGAHGGADDERPAMARGEVRWEGVVEVLTADEAARRLEQGRETLAALAADQQCEAAEEAWERLRLRRPGDRGWRAIVRPQVARTLSACWLDRARAGGERDDRVAHLARARWWDHRTPGLHHEARPLADALIAEGRDAMAARNWDVAYQRFTAALSVDATRAWARRWAEEARDRRLGIDAESVAERDASRERARKEREERRQRVRDARKGAPAKRAGDDE